MSLTNTVAGAASALGLAIIPAAALAQDFRAIDTGVAGPASLGPSIPSAFPNVPAADPDRNVAASPHSPASASPSDEGAEGALGNFKLPSLRKIVAGIAQDLVGAPAPEAPARVRDETPVGPPTLAEESDLELTVADFRPAELPPAAARTAPAVKVAALTTTSPPAQPVQPAPVPAAQAPRVAVIAPSALVSADDAPRPAPLSPRPLAAIDAPSRLVPTSPVFLAEEPMRVAAIAPSTVVSVADMPKAPPLSPIALAAIERPTRSLPSSPVLLAEVEHPPVAVIDPGVEVAVTVPPPLAAIGLREPPPASVRTLPAAELAQADAADAEANASEAVSYEAVQARYQATLAASADAQREYEAEIARWRAAVKACRAGDYKNCAE